ncbi:MAG TPA: glycerol acyltransferase [Gammaproteobacteria bacterium]|jgi:1-acyl-sn-glycerol-3-phosphate acyltransferase|nr:glycerol acyltransferase [Gammaproteobacteria bacterium]
MHEFDAIRPFRDDEADAVIARLCRDPDLRRAAATFFAPRLTKHFPGLARALVGSFISWRTRGLHSVRDVQRWLSRHMGHVIRETTDNLSVTGLDQLSRGVPYLFISNHRDIVMDSALLNFALHEAGFETTRTAIGDNLFTLDCASDLMRLNKGFVVQRRVAGAKAMLKALSLTSAYIRHSLEEGASVWIAHREGRAKDGYDRTDPAVLKMLALAWRGARGGFSDFVDHVRIVPVAVSYEIDPCDLRKARERRIAAEAGSYQKAPGEDLRSMIEGIMGYKGRVHVHIGAPLSSSAADADALALELDRSIARGLRLYPTHANALALAAETSANAAHDTRSIPGERWLPVGNARVMQTWSRRLETCPQSDRPFLLSGYANTAINVANNGL